jgi:hypothetical protein
VKVLPEAERVTPTDRPVRIGMGSRVAAGRGDVADGPRRGGKSGDPVDGPGTATDHDGMVDAECGQLGAAAGKGAARLVGRHRVLMVLSIAV